MLKKASLQTDFRAESGVAGRMGAVPSITMTMTITTRSRGGCG